MPNDDKRTIGELAEAIWQVKLQRARHLDQCSAALSAGESAENVLATMLQGLHSAESEESDLLCEILEALGTKK